MKKRFTRLPRWSILLLAIFGVCLLVLLALQFAWRNPVPKRYGFTWSVTYAEYLSIHPVYGLATALRELHPSTVRLPVYWNKVQSNQKTFDWKMYDDVVRELRSSGTDILFVVGVKQPRWPECWLPAWAKTLNAQEFAKERERYVRAVVARYEKDATAWQVENEPTFFSSFGDCATYSPETLADEVGWVIDERSRLRASSSKMITTTMSGELSTWIPPDTRMTGIGVSIYRVISTTWLDRWSYWFLPPWAYDLHARIARVWNSPRIFVSEFQMEPWIRGEILTIPPEKQFVTFDMKQMQRNFAYARRLERDPVIFWGVEWWLWMKEHKQHPEFWDGAKAFFRTP